MAQFPYSFGWLPDMPDFRDFSPQSSVIRPQLETLKMANIDTDDLPQRVDLRKWCSPIEDQDRLGSCTAQAGTGLLEYFFYKKEGRFIDASRLFLYKVTRNLMGQIGDGGAFLRDTIKAMVLFGVPPEKYYPYNIVFFDDEPSAYCYAFAQNYKSIKYYRLDPPGTPRETLQSRIWTELAAERPVMFGFTVYSSIGQANQTGKIPFPVRTEKVEGGHAVVAVGYDDKMVIKNEVDGSETTGAFLIRNSWGTSWGEQGYGWLPYEYVTRGLAVDWWTLIQAEWVDLDIFGLE